MNTIEMLANAMDKIIDEKVNEKAKEFTFQDVQDWVMKDHSHYTMLLDFLADNNVAFDEYARGKNYINADNIDKDTIREFVYDNSLEEEIAEAYMDNMNSSKKADKVKDWINELI